MYAQVATFIDGTRREIARFTVGADGRIAATGDDPARVRSLLAHRVYDPTQQREVTAQSDPVAWVTWLPGKLRGPGTIARLDPDTQAKVDAAAAPRLLG